MTFGTYIDGGAGHDLANGVVVSRVVSYPFSTLGSGTKQETVLTIEQWANTVSNLEYGSIVSSASGVLTAKGPLVQVGAGIVRFSRTYTEIPTNWNQSTIVSYTFPGLSGGTGENWNPFKFRSPITLFSIATVSHQFTQSGIAPIPAQPFIVTDGNNAVDYIGPSNPNFIGSSLTNPAFEPATYIVSGSVDMLLPTIWENITITVSKPI